MIDDGGSMIEAEIHLAKRPKLFRQTEPVLSTQSLQLATISTKGPFSLRGGRSAYRCRAQFCGEGWNRSLMNVLNTSNWLASVSGSFNAFDMTMPPSSTVETLSASRSTSTVSRGG